jgi:hypothetical protein
MYAITAAEPPRETAAGTGHQWVGAALVGLGTGANERATHAARTGRHVLPERTRIEVLEVYCGRCRLAYSPSAHRLPCVVQAVRAG